MSGPGMRTAAPDEPAVVTFGGRRYGAGGRNRYAFCSKCNVERRAVAFGKTWRCLECGTEVEPPRGAGRADFRNVPKESIAGRLHQSTSEAAHASVVLALRNAGKIENVRGLDRGDPQERFRLDVPSVPAVEALLDYIDARDNGPTANPELGRLARDVRRSFIHVADYLADFTYTSLDPAVGPVGDRIVDDVKGFRNPRMSDAYRRFLMKKALMLACHGLDVREIVVRSKGKR